ncbi:hypothetical protein AKJ16_DCAP16580 [Drosera capensis]
MRTLPLYSRRRWSGTPYFGEQCSMLHVMATLCFFQLSHISTAPEDSVPMLRAQPLSESNQRRLGHQGSWNLDHHGHCISFPGILLAKEDDVPVTLIDKTFQGLAALLLDVLASLKGRYYCVKDWNTLIICIEMKPSLAFSFGPS